jgi:hypothetical protein
MFLDSVGVEVSLEVETEERGLVKVEDFVEMRNYVG